MSNEREIVTRYGMGTPAAQNYGPVPELCIYYNMATTPWTQYVFFQGSWNQVGGTGSGSGDVTGPGSSTAGHFAAFADGTGKVLDDSGDSAASFDAAGAAAAAQAAAEAASDPLGSAAAAQAAAEAYTDSKIVGGTFLPDLRFGGSATGITYNTQSGTYTKVGNLCFVEIKIILTNKGSGSGAAQIRSLPFSTLAGNPSSGGFALESGNLTTTGPVYCLTFQNSTTLAVACAPAPGFLAGTNLTDAEFANNSFLTFAFGYLTQ